MSAENKRISPERSDAVLNTIGKAVILLFAFFALSRAFLGQILYHEIDSNMLPTISMQYRGSILMDESDLTLAQQDYPDLYGGINTYDDLRSAKLVQLPDGKWMAYYFPVYPLLCLPVKLFFQLIRVSQSRCFTVTNALLLSGAMWYAYSRLKLPAKNRLLLVLLLAASPIIYYITYINYEAFIYSLLAISLVQYQNRRYRLSAFTLSLAGMANSTVMAVGMVMIADYLLRIFLHEKGKKFLRIAADNIKDVLLYGACYVPCLVPFAVQKMYLGSSIFGVEDTLQEYFGARVLSYLFDPNLGFFSFAPIQLLLFFVLVAAALCRRDYAAVVWPCFLLGTVCAYSLMVHINCGMIYCARYVAWSYPIIAVYIGCHGIDVIRKRSLQCVSAAVCLLCTGSLMWLNQTNWSVLACQNFNYVTTQILRYAPGLYRPYSATFYSRTLHIDSGYWNSEPAFYKDPATGEVRKLIYKADAGQAELVLRSLSGSEESMEYVEQKLSAAGTDGKFHYINFPQNGSRQVLLFRETEVIRFSGEEWDGNDFVMQGLSSNEGTHTWTDGKELTLRFSLPDYDASQHYRLTLHVAATFNGVQSVIVRDADGRVLLETAADGAADIDIPLTPTPQGAVTLDIELPDAVSPAGLGLSDDGRLLALALQKAVISAA